ncbi:hypothetical protein M5689_007264 [Euphorbia peplus]|nr:hypothetical protein M5689_007264 [Euphorbia peplus]
MSKQSAKHWRLLRKRSIFCSATMAKESSQGGSSSWTKEAPGFLTIWEIVLLKVPCQDVSRTKKLVIQMRNLVSSHHLPHTDEEEADEWPHLDEGFPKLETNFD